MNLNARTFTYYLLFLATSSSLLLSCQSTPQEEKVNQKIEFFSDHSWGRIQFQLPDGFLQLEECQLLWSDAFMVQCYEGPSHGQLQIIASESNHNDLNQLDIFSNTIDYRLDSLSRALPDMQIINVNHHGNGEEHILEFEYFEDGPQSEGYHLEYIVERPGNRFIIRFYAPKADAEQIAEVRQTFESMHIFNQWK